MLLYLSCLLRCLKLATRERRDLATIQCEWRKAMWNRAVCALAIFGLSGLAMAEDWPNWRGPDSNGVSLERGLPLAWSEDENIAWKARLGGMGLSSPIVYSNTIVVTSQAGRGVVREGNYPTLGGRGGAIEERSNRR